MHGLYSCSLSSFLTCREDENGIYYGNKDLFAVDESVQREALKDFYEQRAQVKILPKQYS